MHKDKSRFVILKWLGEVPVREDTCDGSFADGIGQLVSIFSSFNSLVLPPNSQSLLERQTPWL